LIDDHRKSNASSPRQQKALERIEQHAQRKSIQDNNNMMSPQ